MFASNTVLRLYSYAKRVLIVTVILVSLPPLAASALVNVMSLSLLQSEQCPSGWASCPTSTRFYLPVAWQESPSALLQLDDWPANAEGLDGGSEVLRLRRAEVQFALGHRREAAALLWPVTTGSSDGVKSQHVAAARSRLLVPGTFENSLIAAYQSGGQERWQESVAAFRLALAHGAEYMNAEDHAAYLLALAHEFAQRSEGATLPARDSYLAGKYYGLSGQWEKAEEWLERARQSRGWEQMPTSERGQALMLAGMAREAASDYSAAHAAYTEAIATDPSLVEPRIRLLALLQQYGKLDEAGRVRDVINLQGPTYEVGRLDTARTSSPSPALPGGWTLAGYEVDEESLAMGGQMEVWLWWKAAGGQQQPRGDNWLNTGSYWLQHQTVVNLVPNPGLEWGVGTDGFPIGIYPMWDVHFDNVSVLETEGPAGTSQVLQMSQVLGIAAAMSKPKPVESQALYLAGSWIRTDKVGSIGLRCSEQEGFGFHASVAAVGGMAEGVTEQPWQHLTYFGMGKPNPMTNMCVFAYFAEDGGTAQWDQTMLVRLSQLP